jgi:exopolyphosphatase/guanosine-5'-triphosphate,3'-diphosphate pyrophosphatase
MRVAVADIGTNSTRLLVADVDPATRSVAELDRRTTVTRLGQGVDASGALADEAMERVHAALAQYREAIDALGADVQVAVLTSAVRDAANGSAFTEQVRARHGLDARTITGDEEAALTFLGAAGDRADGAPWPVVVIDVGGGSTELVTGDREGMRFHVSTQAGVVRHGERFVHHDPPEPEELQRLAAEARATFAAAVPQDVLRGVAAGIAVAGTATSLAAIAQDLEPYDPARVHGYRLALGVAEEILARLAQMTEEERRRVDGLHPDRAQAIVPGCVLLVEALKAFGLDEVEVSEHDLLRGAALRAAGAA